WLQLKAGAIGITAATVWEAEALAAASIEDILIANEIVGDVKLRHAAAIANSCNLTVAVDSIADAELLDAAMLTADATVGVLIEVDVRMDRGGIRGLDEALELAAAADHHNGLRLVGVMGYERHCVLKPDPDPRRTTASQAMDLLATMA